MPTNRRDGGFTIIEVVLVLAIAGLIFLMVFLALPSLQRGQRDTQRKNDMSRFASAIESYMSNNRGKVPTDNWENFINNYLTGNNGNNNFHDTFTDPSGTDYFVVSGTYKEDASTINPSSTASLSKGISASGYTGTFIAGPIQVWSNAQCGESENTVVYVSGSRKLAFIYKLEGNGYYCGQV